MSIEDHWTDNFFGSLYLRFDPLRSGNIDSCIHGIKVLCEIGIGTKVVELCCGYGRVLIPLVEKTGVDATGIDKSSTFLKAAEEAASERDVVIKWQKTDLVDYRNKNSCDVAYIVGTSLGYYENNQKNLNILLAARSCLKEGGVFLLHQMNYPTGTHGIDEDEEFTYERNGEFDSASGLYKGSYSYHNKITNHNIIFPFRAKLYRRSQLIEMLADCGFEQFKWFGDFDGRPFEEESPDLVITCKASTSPHPKKGE